MADAVRDRRRPGQRGAGAEHRRPRPGRPAAPRSAPRAATPNGSAGAPAPRTCCPASSAAARPGRCSCPSAAPAPPAAPQPRTRAPPPDGPGSATTAPGSCSPGTPGWQLHQLRHSAATHLGEQGIPLQLIMAKTRHRNPRTAMRYVRPGTEAVAEITACSNLHADEAEQYLPALRPVTASVLSRSLSASNITSGRNRAIGGA